jgi:hypothetical protein
MIANEPCLFHSALLYPSVTDDLDRRCLMSVLRQFICPRVVCQECAPLSSSGTYCVPKDGDLESHVQAIRALPRYASCTLDQDSRMSKSCYNRSFIGIVAR